MSKTIQIDPETKQVISMPWQSCPIGAVSPMACMFCPYGHMLECHHPYTCEEAECNHYVEENWEDNYDY